MEALPTPALLKHVLLSEILVVTSVMRKNSRWASSTLVMAVRDTPALGTNMGLRISSPAYHTRLPGRGTREVELMAGFIELKRAVKDMEGDVALLFTHYLCSQIFKIYGKRILPTSLLLFLRFFGRLYRLDLSLHQHFLHYTASSLVVFFHPTHHPSMLL